MNLLSQVLFIFGNKMTNTLKMPSFLKSKQFSIK